MSHRRKSQPKAKRQAARRRAEARETKEFLEEMWDFCTSIGIGVAIEAGDLLENGPDELSDSDQRLLIAVLDAAEQWYAPWIDPDESVDDAITRLRLLWEASQEEPVS